jgi:hypothetical protein
VSFGTGSPLLPDTPKPRLVSLSYLLHDRDSKYCSSFRQLIEAGSVKTLALPVLRKNSVLFRSLTDPRDKPIRLTFIYVYMHRCLTRAVLERIQQVGANSRNLLSPSFVVNCLTFAAVFRNLRYIFVTVA